MCENISGYTVIFSEQDFYYDFYHIFHLKIEPEKFLRLEAIFTLRIIPST